MLQPPDPTVPRPTREEYLAVIDQRDEAVRAAILGQFLGTAAAAEPEAAVEWRRNQRCWVCEQSPRTCRPDPGNKNLPICRHCSQEELA
jgi:hypothetical protein